MGNNLRVTCGFVGNPVFVGKVIFDDSACHPEYDEINFI